MLDNLDQQLILLTQTGLPLVPQPYIWLAEQLNISAEEVMQRMQAMLKSGVIRRIGVVPNHYKLGYKYNGMTVWDIDDAYIDELGQRVGALEFVSHCYHRPRHLPEWPYNLFAMVHAKTQETAEIQIAQIKTLLGQYCRSQQVLYSSRLLKKAGLRIKTQ